MKFKKEKSKTSVSDKKDTKKTKTPHEPVMVRIRRWFFGLGKEFGRINWITKNRLLKDFCVVVVIVLLFATVFFAIDLGFISSGIL